MPAAALLFAVLSVLWQDPGDPGQVNILPPARNVPLPRAPFLFLYEDMNGNSAKVVIRDATGIEWQVKGGPEARAEAFATRIVSAAGYYADSIAFIANGRIEGVKWPLKRAAGFIQRDGSFTWAGFERRDPASRYLKDRDWTWTSNQFSGTRELKGLKVLVMLMSNWDNKDARDRRQGSNTGIMQSGSGPNIRETYFVNDWGQSLGAWGRFRRTAWSCRDYTRQTPDFITGVHDGRVTFGFDGQHTADFSHDITVPDVAWIMRYLGRISVQQVTDALRISGATPAEEQCFSAQFMRRIEMLRNAAGGNGVQ